MAIPILIGRLQSDRLAQLLLTTTIKGERCLESDIQYTEYSFYAELRGPGHVVRRDAAGLLCRAGAFVAAPHRQRH